MSPTQMHNIIEIDTVTPKRPNGYLTFSGLMFWGWLGRGGPETIAMASSKSLKIGGALSNNSVI